MTDHTLRGLSAAEVLQRYVDAYPAFRIKPKGEPGSPARIEQENLMALEDAARLALSNHSAGQAPQKTPKDGGCAFPTTSPLESWGDPNRGMSLRDWFAGQALPPLITTASDTRNSDWPVTVSEIAMKAYQFADVMLAEREKTS